MKIREYSDIHLDHYRDSDKWWYPPEMPDDKDTILIIAGDLSTGTMFIDWAKEVSKRFKQILIALGNHDYWPVKHGLTILQGAARCNAMIQDLGLDNVKVLENDTWEHEDVIFVGTTLWTDMNKGNEFTMRMLNHFMSYDGRIAYETGPGGMWRRFTSQLWINTHLRAVQYIRHVAEQNRDKRLVVITHHLPLTTLGDPVFEGDLANPYYYSDLSDLILDNENIKYWFYGHTHYQKETDMVHCKIINNCVGYPGQMFEAKGLVKHKVIEI